MKAPSAQTFESSAPRRSLRTPQGAATQPRDLSQRVLFWDDLDRVGITDKLVRGLIGEGSVAIMCGVPGCGKSFAAIDLSLHIACGWDWLGRKVQRGAVLYIAGEGQRGVINRVAAFRRHHAVADASPPPFALLPVPVDLVSDASSRGQVMGAIRFVEERTREAVRLVVVDTLARCFGGGNENAPEDMNSFLSSIDYIRGQSGASALIIHHTGKDAVRGPRGHSALLGAADTVIEISGVDGVRSGTVAKQKDGTAGAAFSFRLESIEVGDVDGESVSSCIVVPADAAAARPAVKLSHACSIALAALRQAIDEAGEDAGNHRQIPARVRTVPIELWRKYAYARAISSEGDEARRKAFKRSSEQLQARGMVCAWANLVWLP